MDRIDEVQYNISAPLPLRERSVRATVQLLVGEQGKKGEGGELGEGVSVDPLSRLLVCLCVWGQECFGPFAVLIFPSGTCPHSPTHSPTRPPARLPARPPACPRSHAPHHMHTDAEEDGVVGVAAPSSEASRPPSRSLKTKLQQDMERLLGQVQRKDTMSLFKAPVKEEDVSFGGESCRGRKKGWKWVCVWGGGGTVELDTCAPSATPCTGLRVCNCTCTHMPASPSSSTSERRLRLHY
jgi:hypothetical protein